MDLRGACSQTELKFGELTEQNLKQMKKEYETKIAMLKQGIDTMPINYQCDIMSFEPCDFEKEIKTQQKLLRGAKYALDTLKACHKQTMKASEVYVLLFFCLKKI